MIAVLPVALLRPSVYFYEPYLVDVVNRDGSWDEVFYPIPIRQASCHTSAILSTHVVGGLVDMHISSSLDHCGETA